MYSCICNPVRYKYYHFLPIIYIFIVTMHFNIIHHPQQYIFHFQKQNDTTAIQHNVYISPTFISYNNMIRRVMVLLKRTHAEYKYVIQLLIQHTYIMYISCIYTNGHGENRRFIVMCCFSFRLALASDYTLGST